MAKGAMSRTTRIAKLEAKLERMFNDLGVAIGELCDLLGEMDEELLLEKRKE